MINKQRLQEIDDYVDSVKPDDYINTIINKYDLKDYKYIDSVEAFSLLRLRGTIKYVNKYDQKLRYGGLVVKIYKRETNQQWYCIIIKENKKYYVSYNSNYIFYMESKHDALLDWANCFISDYDKGLYETQ
jgi:hypothetical protein